MALTADIIKGIPGLETLTPEQVQAIVTASTTDEAKVVTDKIGVYQTALESKFVQAAGVDKIIGEKFEDYYIRVVGGLKTKQTELSTELEALKSGSGNKAELEKTLSAQVTKISELTQQIADAKTEHSNKLNEAKVGFAFKEAASTLTLKEAFQGDIANILVKQSQNEILAKYDTEFTEAGLVFKDKTTGEIARNPENSLQPFTIQELYKTTVLATAIDSTPKVPGAGSKPPTGSSFTSIIPGAKTQVEADLQLHDILVKKGLTRGSQEYAQEQHKLRVENKVDELPLR